MAEIVVVCIGYFLFCFGAAWIFARDQVMAAWRNRTEEWIRDRTYHRADRRFLGAQAIYLLSCVECQSFWIGLAVAWVPCGVVSEHLAGAARTCARGPIGWCIAAVILRGAVAIVYRRLFRVIGD